MAFKRNIFDWRIVEFSKIKTGRVKININIKKLCNYVFIGENWSNHQRISVKFHHRVDERK
jgi:hypothetical protein